MERLREWEREWECLLDWEGGAATPSLNDSNCGVYVSGVVE
jgi:hypothetical protein